ncbi:unnamed protein product [Periconia digitata]|uniref:Uncharacterized protein n=1 Tax=Periconia digitata TaxID=1303443 RepID=A0A9W4U5V3_9PLEO|nr:unnamed protein product [Periconia digitata]
MPFSCRLDIGADKSNSHRTLDMKRVPVLLATSRRGDMVMFQPRQRSPSAYSDMYTGVAVSGFRFVLVQLLSAPPASSSELLLKLHPSPPAASVLLQPLHALVLPAVPAALSKSFLHAAVLASLPPISPEFVELVSYPELFESSHHQPDPQPLFPPLPSGIRFLASSDPPGLILVGAPSYPSRSFSILLCRSLSLRSFSSSVSTAVLYMGDSNHALQLVFQASSEASAAIILPKFAISCSSFRIRRCNSKTEESWAFFLVNHRELRSCFDFWMAAICAASACAADCCVEVGGGPGVCLLEEEGRPRVMDGYKIS